MTDPSDPWARRADPNPYPRPAEGEQPTQRIPQGGGQPHDPAPAWAGPPQQQPWSDTPTSTVPASGEPVEPPPPGSRFSRFLRDPLSLVLVVVIVLAMAAAGLIGGEIFARHKGNSIVAEATKCTVNDDATASFGGATPFLWQFATSHYSNLTIDTAGNQLLDIKGMKAQIALDDIRLQDSGDSKGTIGSLDATITWSSDGIKQTVQNKIGDLGTTIDGVFQQYLGNIPFLGNLLGGSQAGGLLAKSITINDVKTDASAGTILVSYSAGGGLAQGTLTVTPVVENEALSLQVGDVTIAGQPVPHELLEDPLKLFTQSLTNDLPFGVKAKSVQVTDTGVIAAYGTQNASIPAGQQDACFAGV